MKKGYKDNIEKLTISQLKTFKIPYHQLILGKPYAHFYIDDLSVNSYENLPFALGYDYEKNTYREFNNVTVGENYTVKSSKNIRKIKNEIKYIKNLPITIKNYFPEILEQGKDSYKMETIKGASYSYLYLNKLLLNSDIDLLNLVFVGQNLNCIITKSQILVTYATIQDFFHKNKNKIDEQLYFTSNSHRLSFSNVQYAKE